MDRQTYHALVKKASPTVSVLKTAPASFFIGGIICMFAEAVRLMFLNLNFSYEDAGSFVSVILIIITAILTATGIFHKIAKVAGAGTLVPITGFANSVIAPALEFQTEGFISGAACKMFIIAGPVIVYGTVASILCGIYFYILGLFGG